MRIIGEIRGKNLGNAVLMQLVVEARPADLEELGSPDSIAADRVCVELCRSGHGGIEAGGA